MVEAASSCRAHVYPEIRRLSNSINANSVGHSCENGVPGKDARARSAKGFRGDVMVWKKLQQLEVAAAAAARKPQWRAVEIVAPRSACPAAQSLKAKRFLSADAPALPVPECIRPGECRCIYKKHTDRRDGPRREDEDTGIRRFVLPSEDRRARPGRRESD
jgi:hypothetical protein